MALQQIPLNNSPNAARQVTVSINGGASTFFFILRYNEIANYWVGTFYNVQNPAILLVDSLPLVTGTNLLGQLQYLNAGSLYILNASNVPSPDYPNSLDLGSDFILAWGDDVTVTVDA